jgi:hypothetical protein
MSKPLKSAAAVLAGAVVLASGAYALGSERGAGTASARDGTAAGAPARFGYRRRAGGPELDALAAKLGVSASKLQAALQDLRPDKPGTDPRSRFAASLASALALPPSRVNAALAKLGPPRGELRGPPPEFVNGLASALGLDAGKVRAAFVKLRSQGRGPGAGPDAFLPALASELGVDQGKLQTALRKLRPGGPPRLAPRGMRGPGMRGPGMREPGEGRVAADLAKALGVDTATLRKALDKVRSQQRDAFTAALAKRLGVEQAKVEQALESLPGPRGRRP